MENPSFEKKKSGTNTLFAPDFVLAMVVSGRVLKKPLRLFKSGPKSCTYIWKIRANYTQVKLVNKIEEDRTAKKIDIYTKEQKFVNTTF